MRRVATDGEFRSNVHRGARTERVELDRVYERTAIRAAHILGLHVAGVDMLEGRDGPLIAEVNSSPGLEGIEGASGVDVAGAIIEFVESRGVFPGFDLRQRLTHSSGYGLCELAVPEGAALVGSTIADSPLRELDIAVLTLERGGNTIPNPRSERTLEAGDRLLCFGKLEAMKAFLSPRKTRPPRSLGAPGGGSGR